MIWLAIAQTESQILEIYSMVQTRSVSRHPSPNTFLVKRVCDIDQYF